MLEQYPVYAWHFCFEKIKIGLNSSLTSRLFVFVFTKDFLPHFILGNVLGKAGYIDKAIDEFNLGLKINPSHSGFYFSLGDAYYLKSNFKESENAYKQFIKIEKKNIKPFLADIELSKKIIKAHSI